MFSLSDLLTRLHEHFTHHSTISLPFFYHLLVCTSPTIYMDAIIHVTSLFLFVLSGPCIFYSNHTAQQSHHHCNNNRYHAIFLLALASQFNEGHTTESKGILLWLHHTFFASYTYLEHTVMYTPMSLPSSRFYYDMEQIPIVMEFFPTTLSHPCRVLY